ncbi:MAG: HAMP domain-containing histidine kinase [Methylocystaceae bacterium]|nr:HAMP domain-containing histidine kinase [Methylocystaceae bacterium]
MAMGIRGKLISVFILIKVIPLVLLGGMTWQAVLDFGQKTAEKSQVITDQMKQTVVDAGNIATMNSVHALDDKEREAIERQTTDMARDIAAFLYGRDREVLYAATLAPDETSYQNFIQAHQQPITNHGDWVLDEEQGKWIAKDSENDKTPQRHAQIKANEKQFSYRPADPMLRDDMRALYREMTFVDLSGMERIKVTSHPLMSSEKKDISKSENTFIKAERYFSELQKLKPGEIYVSDVIGVYVPSKVVGPYTKKNAKRAGVDFAPEQAAYAGKENPVGKRFEGIIRWATPVLKNGKIIGYVTLALDHRHVMEFSDHHVPTDERYSTISDAGSGNYAFIWDYKARNISHPRDYFIYGYDPETGKPEVPWLSQKLYDGWQASGLDLESYLKDIPLFLDQGTLNKPAKELTKQGKLSLDCRYLNFAPQCAGWWNLTEDGGSGSFQLFWSGLWKLTTAATIPYYTGQYAKSKRGFGFVTIGANVEEFHRAANDTRHLLDSLIEVQGVKAAEQEADLLASLEKSMEKTAVNLIVYTGIMVLVVVFVAIVMANSLSDRIKSLIKSLHKIEKGDLSVRVKVSSYDEMGQLAVSLNKMTESLQNNIEKNKEAVAVAEASSRAKTDFLANMSHELRTPLNAIIGFSDFIRHEIRGPIEPAAYKNYVDDIHLSGKHLLKLINDILDISRIGSGEVRLSEEVFDLNQMLDDALRMMAPQAGRKSITLKSELADNLRLKGDRRRIKQISLNMLSNAIKFSRDKAEVSVSAYKDAQGRLVMSFKDYGIGMSRDETESALTPFVQVQTSLSRQYEGTGLGLPLAKSLTQLHDGTLEIISEPGVGTEVIVTFPKERVAPADG